VGWTGARLARLLLAPGTSGQLRPRARELAGERQLLALAVVMLAHAASGDLGMARTSTAGKQKRKIKAKGRKVVRHRAMVARINVPDTKRRAADARPKDEMEKATGTKAGRADLQRDTTQLNDHHEARVTIQPSDTPIAERLSKSGHEQPPRHPPSHGVEVYNYTMGTAMQALQWLLALPFRNWQIWQDALFGVRRLGR
jgi:hypothetical protein